jgi:hypothetical protein
LSLGASTSTEGNDDTDATFLDIGTYCYRSTLVGADTDRTCAKCSARSSQRYGDRRSGHRSGYRTGRPRHRSGICQYGEGRRSSHGRSGKGRWNDGGKDRQRRVVHRYTRLCLLGASRLSGARLSVEYERGSSWMSAYGTKRTKSFGARMSADPKPTSMGPPALAPCALLPRA